MAWITAAYRSACITAMSFAERHPTPLLLVLGIVLLGGGLTELSIAQLEDAGAFNEADFDEQLIRYSQGGLFRLVEGAMPTLIMAGAGLAGIIAAAVDAHRAAAGLLAVAIGAFIFRAVCWRYFSDGYATVDLGIVIPINVP